MDKSYKIDILNQLSDMVDIVQENLEQENKIESLRVEKAMYKAYFFGQNDLAEKLSEQVKENRNALIGAFDGFSYSSIRANSKFRTLEDMRDKQILTEKEYKESII